MNTFTFCKIYYNTIIRINQSSKCKQKSVDFCAIYTMLGAASDTCNKWVEFLFDIKGGGFAVTA